MSIRDREYIDPVLRGWTDPVLSKIRFLMVFQVQTFCLCQIREHVMYCVFLSWLCVHRWCLDIHASKKCISIEWIIYQTSPEHFRRYERIEKERKKADRPTLTKRAKMVLTKKLILTDLFYLVPSPRTWLAEHINFNFQILKTGAKLS